MGFLSGFKGILGTVIAGPIGGAIGSALDAKDANKKASKAARNATDQANAYNDPAAIRARYEAAGFNPLLGVSNGASPYQAFSPQSFSTEAGQGALILQAASKDQALIDIEKSRLDLEKAKVAELIKSNTFKPKVGGLYSGSVPTARASVQDFAPEFGTGKNLGIQNVKPKSRLDALGMWSEGSTFVIMPDGSEGEMPTKMLKRIDPDAKAGFQIIAEDFEAVFGDEIGQLVLAPRLKGIVDQVLGGVSTVRSQEERQRKLDNPDSFVEAIIPKFKTSHIQRQRDARKDVGARRNDKQRDFMKEFFPSVFDQ